MREIAARLLLLGGGLLVAVLGTELVLRVVHGRTRQELLVPSGLFRWDPRLGWAGLPGAAGVSHYFGHPVHYTINSHGLRDDETAYAKPADVFRMVVVGDSDTFGEGIPVERHFTRLLEGYFRNLEVLNLGVSGYGIDQELLALQLEGVRYQPDVVLALVLHYGSHRHMHSVRFGKAKPRFVRGPEGLVLVNSPVPDPYAPAPVTDRSLPARLDRKLRHRSRLYARFFPGPAAAPPPADPEPDAAFEAEVHALGREIFREMQGSAAAHGARFLLITKQPRIAASVDGTGIPVLDLRAALDNPFFHLDEPAGHPNEAANGVIAREIARFLTERAWIPAAHRRGA